MKITFKAEMRNGIMAATEAVLRDGTVGDW